METFLLDKYLSEHLNYDLLPKDCPAAAAERMRKSYNLKRCYDIIDVAIVLGDITKGVSSINFFEKFEKGL